MRSATDRVTRLLEKLDLAWTEFQQSYAGLTDDDLAQPDVTGEWSVRETIAHVTWWDEEAIEHLPLILEGGRPPRYSVKYGGINAFNALKTRELRELGDRSLAEVRARAEETHRRLIAYLESLPPERVIDERLRLDTYGHYALHTKAIRAWREQRAAAAGETEARAE